MRFTTFLHEDEQRVGLIFNEDLVIDLVEAQKERGESESIPGTLIECIDEGERFLELVLELEAWVKATQSTVSVFPLNEVKLLAPIPRPRKNIFCVGKNYAAHAIEMGSAADIPEYPMLFSKAPTTVIGPNDEIEPHNHLTSELDYEGEIAIVIGKKGKRIAKEVAMDYVFGYMLLNDVTARDLQRRHKQFLLGKSIDTFCPTGPWLTHKSLISDPSDLTLTTKVNGELRQTGYTKHFIFDIPTIIETISAGTTLEPGDIIATGTPAGVGNGFNPPKFLKQGDVIEIEVKELGMLVNRVATE
ncbi:MAG TPA: fumarylacetoacetate hydrolase family protein [Bacilli bacterium]|nr:fumarylacetoacetate hydrolase family protein [Bacilli bacterium]